MLKTAVIKECFLLPEGLFWVGFCRQLNFSERQLSEETLIYQLRSIVANKCLFYKNLHLLSAR